MKQSGVWAQFQDQDLDQIAYLELCHGRRRRRQHRDGRNIGVAMDAGVIPWGDGEAAWIWSNKSVKAPAGPDHRLWRWNYKRVLRYVQGSCCEKPNHSAYDPRALRADLCHHSHGRRPHCRLPLRPTSRLAALLNPPKGQRGAVRNLQIATAAVDTPVCACLSLAILDIPKVHISD